MAEPRNRMKPGRPTKYTDALADEICDGRWVATGGGGYQPYRVIPRAWALVWMAMTGREVPVHVDRDWAGG